MQNTVTDALENSNIQRFGVSKLFFFFKKFILLFSKDALN